MSNFDLTTQMLRQKIASHSELTEFTVSKQSLFSLKDWIYDEKKGVIHHKSGRFFAISSINSQDVEQPILLQTEVGILGFLRAAYKGQYFYLFQMKSEPGNFPSVQLAPTVQATKSNYERVHGGSTPVYLEYFQSPDRKVVFDTPQTEQGSRYLSKINHNCMVDVSPDIRVKPGFLWISRKQIRELLKEKSLINSCARSILAIEMSPADRWSNNPSSFIKSFVRKNTNVSDRSGVNIELGSKPLDELADWEFSDSGLLRRQSKSDFSIGGVNVHIENRENANWEQPIVYESGEGLYELWCANIDGKIKFIFNLSREIGMQKKWSILPSLIIRSGVLYKHTPPVQEELKSTLLEEQIYSEEGGRFFQAEFRHRIKFLGEVTNDFLCDYNLIALTLTEIGSLLRNTDLFSIEARSILLLAMTHEFEI